MHGDAHTHPHIEAGTLIHTHHCRFLLYFLLILHLSESLSTASLLTLPHAVYKDVSHSFSHSFSDKMSKKVSPSSRSLHSSLHTAQGVYNVLQLLCLFERINTRNPSWSISMAICFVNALQFSWRCCSGEQEKGSAVQNCQQYCRNRVIANVIYTCSLSANRVQTFIDSSQRNCEEKIIFFKWFS